MNYCLVSKVWLLTRREKPGFFKMEEESLTSFLLFFSKFKSELIEIDDLSRLPDLLTSELFRSSSLTSEWLSSWETISDTLLPCRLRLNDCYFFGFFVLKTNLTVCLSLVVCTVGIVSVITYSNVVSELTFFFSVFFSAVQGATCSSFLSFFGEWSLSVGCKANYPDYTFVLLRWCLCLSLNLILMIWFSWCFDLFALLRIRSFLLKMSLWSSSSQYLSFLPYVNAVKTLVSRR